jgi:uncharacterized SAM-dependent methyltransferase
MHNLRIGDYLVEIVHIATHRWEIRLFNSKDYSCFAVHRGSRAFINAYLEMKGRHQVRWHRLRLT